MQLQYTPAQRSALQDEREKLQTRIRSHETDCQQCFTAIIDPLAYTRFCSRYESFQDELDSLNEALGFSNLDREASQTGPEYLDPKVLEDINERSERTLYHATEFATNSTFFSDYYFDRKDVPTPELIDWWATATVDPWQRDEGSYWDALHEDHVFTATEDEHRSGTGRQRHITRHESIWLEHLASLASTPEDAKTIQEALRVWFPKQTPLPENWTGEDTRHDIAIYKTFLKVKVDSQGTPYAEAFCSAKGCKRRTLIAAVPVHLIATIQHALSHAPASVRNGVEFFHTAEDPNAPDPFGTLRMHITTSSTRTEDQLNESFLADAQKLLTASATYAANGQLTNAAKLRASAAWYARAAGLTQAEFDDL